MLPVWRVLVLLCMLALLAVAGFTALLTRVDGDAFAAESARQLSAALGREITIEGGAHVGLWPLPGLHSGRIAARDGTLEAPSAVLVPDPLALLGGEARPWSLVLIRPRMVLRLDGDRPVAAAWQGTLRHVGALAGTVRLEGWGAAIDVRRASMLVSSWRGLSLRLVGDWNGRAVSGRFAVKGTDEVSLSLRAGDDHVSYDGRLGRDNADRLNADGRLAMAVADAGALSGALGLSPPSLIAGTGAFELEAETRLLPDELRLKLSAAADVAGRTASLRVAMHGGPDWRRDGAGTVEVVSRGGGLYSAYFSGRQTGPEGLDGQLTLSVSDLPGFQDWLGVPGSARLLDGARASLRAGLAADATGIRLTGAEVAVDKLAISGELGLEFGAVHSLTGAIGLSELDLTDLHATGYARLRAALAALGKAGVDLAVTLRTPRVRLGNLVLADMQAGLTHRDGEAVVEVARVDVLEGVAGGSARMATAGPARLTGEAAVAEVDAGAVSRALGHDLLTGALAGEARFEVPDLHVPVLNGLALEGAISVSAGTTTLPLAGGGADAFRQFDAQIGLSGGALTLDAMTMDTREGRYTGRLTLGLADGRLEGSSTGPDGRRLALGGTVDAPATRPLEPDAAEREPSRPAVAAEAEAAEPAAAADTGTAAAAEPADIDDAVPPASDEPDADVTPDDDPVDPPDAETAAAPATTPDAAGDAAVPATPEPAADPRFPIPIPAPR